MCTVNLWSSLYSNITSNYGALPLSQKESFVLCLRKSKKFQSIVRDRSRLSEQTDPECPNRRIQSVRTEDIRYMLFSSRREEPAFVKNS